MPPTTGPGWLERVTWRKALAAVLVLEAVVIAMVLVINSAESGPEPAPKPPAKRSRVVWRDNFDKPTVLPPVLPAAEAKIDPAEPVIGVEVGGEARAYRVAAFDDASGHLVNDLIGGVPISVAYSNLSRRARVYTDAKGSRPLDAEVTGLLNRQMVLKLGGHSYLHDSGTPADPEENPPPIPYQLLTPTMTSWGEWKRLHPQTQAYVGGR